MSNELICAEQAASVFFVDLRKTDHSTHVVVEGLSEDGYMVGLARHTTQLKVQCLDTA